MTGQWNSKEGRAVYVCSARKHGAGCSCRRVDADRVENLVRAKIGLNLLSRKNLDRLLADFLSENPANATDELTQIGTRIAEIDRRLQRILVLDDLDADALQEAVAELTAQKRDLAARRKALAQVAARTEARDELADQLRIAAEKALDNLYTADGLRAALNSFDLSVGFNRNNGDSRRLRITGRVVLDPASDVLAPAASSVR